MLGLDTNLIDLATEKFLRLYQKYEELNLLTIEAKLDIKNFYTFINKYALRLSSINEPPSENENAYNPLNKYVVDINRLIKFIDNKNGEFRLERCKSLLEPNKKFSQEINTESQSNIEDIFVENLRKVYDKKESAEIDSSGEKINFILQEGVDLFNKIYGLPHTRISKYYRSLQEMILSTSENSVVFDMFVDSVMMSAIKGPAMDSSRINYSLRYGHKEDDHNKTTVSTHNLSDSNEIVNEVVLALKYNLLNGEKPAL